jgi:hypothetical protein
VLLVGDPEALGAFGLGALGICPFGLGLLAVGVVVGAALGELALAAGAADTAERCGVSFCMSCGFGW